MVSWINGNIIRFSGQKIFLFDQLAFDVGSLQSNSKIKPLPWHPICLSRSFCTWLGTLCGKAGLPNRESTHQYFYFKINKAWKEFPKKNALSEQWIFCIHQSVPFLANLVRDITDIWPHLLRWFNFNLSAVKSLRPLKSVGWNYLSIPKLQRLHLWSLEMDK